MSLPAGDVPSRDPGNERKAQLQSRRATEARFRQQFARVWEAKNFARESAPWSSGVSSSDERCPRKGGSVDVSLATQVVVIRNVSPADRRRLPEDCARGVQARGARGRGRAGTAGFLVLRSTAAGFEAISVTRAAMGAAAVRARRQAAVVQQAGAGPEWR